MNMRFEPARGLSGELSAPADKSISHRAALLGAMASEPVRIERYLHAADTNSTLQAVRALGALVEVHGDELVVRGTGLREAREPDEPIDVGNAGTLLRLAARLARRTGGPLVHARRRRVDPPPARRPDRRATAPDGRSARRARRTLRAADRTRHAPARDRLRAGGRKRPGQVLRAARRTRRRRRHHRRRAHPQPRPHRAHAAARRRRHPPQRSPRHRRQRRRAAARAHSRFPATQLSRVPRSPPACSYPARAC